MARTTVEDCLGDNESHFVLAHEVARRAREIMRRGNVMVQEYDDKAVVIALRETAERRRAQAVLTADTA